MAVGVACQEARHDGRQGRSLSVIARASAERSPARSRTSRSRVAGIIGTPSAARSMARTAASGEETCTCGPAGAVVDVVEAEDVATARRLTTGATGHRYATGVVTRPLTLTPRRSVRVVAMFSHERDKRGYEVSGGGGGDCWCPHLLKSRCVEPD